MTNPSLSLAAILVLLALPAANAQTNTLPKGFGFSAKYPGDAGIARDASVLFSEDFETGDLDVVKKRWNEASDKDGKVLALRDDAPKASRGKRCIELTATPGVNTGGHLYSKLKREVDTAFFRFYVKFAKDADYIHHFVHVGGYRPATSYPQGGAGDCPRGDERITVGIEPYGSRGKFPAPGAWNLYAYWHEMKVSAGGKYWGNAMHPLQPALVPRERWQCVELMLTLNSTPDKHDGELVLWLDGEPVMHILKGVRRTQWTGMGFSVTEREGEPFEGFNFRNSPELKLNFFWLLHYVTELAARQNDVPQPTRQNRVWFDDIVVSEKYVGPIAP